MALPLVAGMVTVNVNVAGRPALMVAGGAMTSVGEAATLTTTLPDAWPVAAGVVVVPPPVPVPVPVPPPPVPVPPVDPTVAVTVAVVDVRRFDVATPFASVVAIAGSMTPAVVENATGAAERGLPLTSATTAA